MAGRTAFGKGRGVRRIPDVLFTSAAEAAAAAPVGRGCERCARACHSRKKRSRTIWRRAVGYSLAGFSMSRSHCRGEGTGRRHA